MPATTFTELIKILAISSISRTLTASVYSVSRMQTSYGVSEVAVQPRAVVPSIIDLMSQNTGVAVESSRKRKDPGSVNSNAALPPSKALKTARVSIGSDIE